MRYESGISDSIPRTVCGLYAKQGCFDLHHSPSFNHEDSDFYKRLSPKILLKVRFRWSHHAGYVGGRVGLAWPGLGRTMSHTRSGAKRPSKMTVSARDQALGRCPFATSEAFGLRLTKNCALPPAGGVFWWPREWDTVCFPRPSPSAPTFHLG